MRHDNTYTYPSMDYIFTISTEYSDENGDMSAWYNYNAGGDRNFKITSPSLNIRQNAVGLRYSAHLKYPTLYASALITFNKGGYTKHYFEGTNRVCSKIGGGFRNVHWDNIEDRIPTLVEDYDQLSEGQRESVERTFNECLNMGVEMDGIIDLYEVVSHESGRDDQEPAFFYHSDHLGSAAYLTNDAGQVTQTLNYLPYGEDWVDIQNYVETRYPRLGIYTYNGKEKDYESGFHYYGARYYWSELLTGWLSVDPMMDKYPNISTYHYCHWNPINIIDPNGMLDDEWKVNKCGEIVERIENNDYDQIHIVDDEGNTIASSEQYEVGTISEIQLSNSDATSFSVCGNQNAEELFQFFAANHTADGGYPLEWGHATLAGSTDESNIIGTNHAEHSIHLLSDITTNGYSVNDFSHNHPLGNPTPSGGVGVPGKDLGNAVIHEKNHPGISLYTYTPKTGYTQYNGNNGCLDDRLFDSWKNATWQGKNKQ